MNHGCVSYIPTGDADKMKYNYSRDHQKGIRLADNTQPHILQTNDDGNRFHIRYTLDKIYLQAFHVSNAFK